MNCGDFKAFVENVKEHTDLTKWMLAIKANPKDSAMYLVLSDFLSEQGGLDALVGDYLRTVVNNQKQEPDEEIEMRLKGTYGLTDVHSNDQEIAKLGREINKRFKDLGIGDKVDDRDAYLNVNKPVTQHHRRYKGKLTTVQMRDAGSIEKMSLSVNQDNDRPHNSPSQLDYPNMKVWLRNNVGYQDLKNRNLQLYGIFLIAQKIAVNLLILSGNEESGCSQNGYISLGDHLMNNWIIQVWTDEDQTELAVVVYNYEEILIPIRKSWECCDNFKEDSVEQLINQLYYLDVERLSDEFIDNRMVKSIVKQWIEALEDWKRSGCGVYRNRISRIIRDFRDSTKARRRFRGNT